MWKPVKSTLSSFYIWMFTSDCLREPCHQILRGTLSNTDPHLYLVFEFSIKSKLVFWFSVWYLITSQPINSGFQVTWFELLNIINICEGRNKNVLFKKPYILSNTVSCGLRKAGNVRPTPDQIIANCASDAWHISYHKQTSDVKKKSRLPYVKHCSFIPQTSTESLRDTSFFLPGSSQGYTAQETDR